MSKADYVRTHSSLAAKEVVAKAKAEGLNVDLHYVCKVRGYDRKAQVKKNAGARKPYARPTITPVKVAPPASSFATPTISTSAAEDLVRTIAAELEQGRAVEGLEGEPARVRGDDQRVRARWRLGAGPSPPEVCLALAAMLCPTSTSFEAGRVPAPEGLLPVALSPSRYHGLHGHARIVAAVQHVLDVRPALQVGGVEDPGEGSPPSVRHAEAT